MAFEEAADPSAGVAVELGKDWIHRSDMKRTVDLVGRDYRFEGPPWPEHEPLLQGLFHTERLRPGLVLHRTRLHDLHDMRTSLMLEPGLKLVLVLEGSSEIMLGSHQLQLGPGRPPDGRSPYMATMVSLVEPARFARVWCRGRHEAKVSLTLQAQWLDGGGLEDGPEVDAVRRFREEHLARQDWLPSARALGLAHQMVHAPALRPRLLRLYLESRAIELAAEALAALVEVDTRTPGGLNARDHRRLRELCARLDRGELDQLDLVAMACDVGMSASTLQRKFRMFTGGTLFDYVRRRRLELARRVRISANVTGDFGNVTDPRLGAGLRG